MPIADIMDANHAVEFRHVSKLYQLGESNTSLREALAGAASRMLRRGAAERVELFWALRDVTFDVRLGESIGIIGHNGAGKSTILKILSKVTYPSSGTVNVRGRLAALIELGAGFHPDLSGRENIFLNGSILGLKQAEISAQFDRIVAFAGLEQFIDTPVKRYSSGMYVRLAFAVAAHVQADVLLIDEVLSVGDAAFQERCLDKMREMHANGTTIALISHNLWSVQTFCTRAILMNHGRIEADGEPAGVIDVYRHNERQEMLSEAQAVLEGSPQADTALAAVSGVDLFDAGQPGGEPTAQFGFYPVIRARVRFSVVDRLADPVYVVKIRRADGLVCCSMTSRSEREIGVPLAAGEHAFEARIGPLQLVPDFYTLEVHIVDRHRPLVYASSARVAFRIEGGLSETSDAGLFAPETHWSAAG